MDVGSWLRSLGLGQYEANFRDNKIDADVLPQLTDSDLKELGVSAVGDRTQAARRQSPRCLAQRPTGMRSLPAQARTGRRPSDFRRAPPHHRDVLRSCRLDEPCRET